MLKYKILLPLSAVHLIAARRNPSSLATPRRGVAVSRPGWIAAFGNPKYFTDKYITSETPDVSLKVPKFDVLFDEICRVSPLAKQAITQDRPGGIAAIDRTTDFYNGKDALDANDDAYEWKVVDENAKRLVSRIDKIDNFRGRGVPLQRLRATLRGPTKQRGLCFAELVSVTELRQKYDATCALVDTIYSAADMKEVEALQGNKYGEAILFGIGYVKTKQSVVSPREQMTLCGSQIFPSGASITWGTELEEDQNYLFPEDQPKRMPRSTSHLFAVTIIPRIDDPETFDVEYVLQVEVGGFPGWLTGPIVLDTLKKCFRFAEGYFESGYEDEGALSKRLALLPDNDVEEEGEEGVVDDAVEDETDADETGSSDVDRTSPIPPAADRDQQPGEDIETMKSLIGSLKEDVGELKYDVGEKKALLELYESERKSFRKTAKLAAKAAKEKIGTKTKRLLGLEEKDSGSNVP